MTNSITGVSAESIQIPLAQPFKVDKKTNDSLFFSSATYSWYMPNGTQVKVVAPNKSKENVYDMFTVFNNYSTKDDPDITEDELLKIKTELQRTMFPENKTKLDKVIDFFSENAFLRKQGYNVLNNLFNTYSGENTRGGKNITPAEQLKIINTLSIYIASGNVNYIKPADNQ